MTNNPEGFGEKNETSIFEILGISENAGPHEILGIDIESTADDAKIKYKELVRQYHPDICTRYSNSVCTELIKAINTAFDSFTNPSSSNEDRSKSERTSQQKNPFEDVDLDDLFRDNYPTPEI